MTSSDSQWANVLRRQDGVISREQLLGSGRSTRQVRYAVQTGRWIPVLPGVLRPALLPLTTRGRIRATGLWAGSAGSISGWAAAWWWGLVDDAPVTPEVTIPHHVRRVVPMQISVIRSDLEVEDRGRHQGLDLTSLPLSALHGAVAGGGR